MNVPTKKSVFSNLDHQFLIVFWGVRNYFLFLQHTRTHQFCLTVCLSVADSVCFLSVCLLSPVSRVVFEFVRTSVADHV